ncbi:Merozoite surface protein 1 [Balamuthia mandrillaris]
MTIVEEEKKEENKQEEEKATTTTTTVKLTKEQREEKKKQKKRMQRKKMKLKLKQRKQEAKAKASCKAVSLRASCENRPMTLSYLVKRLHLSSPAENVLAVLGKRYPATIQEFLKCGLKGPFDPSKAGQRLNQLSFWVTTDDASQTASSDTTATLPLSFVGEQNSNNKKKRKFSETEKEWHKHVQLYPNDAKKVIAAITRRAEEKEEEEEQGEAAPISPFLYSLENLCSIAKQEHMKRKQLRRAIINERRGTRSDGSASTSSLALTRLLKDLKELQRDPLPNCTALPLPNDIFTWHANIRTDETTCFHLIIRFPRTYPMEPPIVKLCTFLPHPNVFHSRQGDVRSLAVFVQEYARNMTAAAAAASSSTATSSTAQKTERRLEEEGDHYYVCLDMLEPPDEDEKTPYRGWSSAYSVHSLLMQLQSFLLDESRQWATAKMGDFNDAVRHAKQFECEQCGHKGESPFGHWPAFPTAAQLEQHSQRKKVVRFHSSMLPPSAYDTTGEKEKEKETEKERRSMKRKRGEEEEEEEVEEQEPEKVDRGRVDWTEEVQKLITKNRRLVLHRILSQKLALPALEVTENKKEKEKEKEKEIEEEEHSSYGNFDRLPYEVMIHILSFLSARDLLSAASTCRALYSLCEDGWLWRDLFSIHHPESKLTAQNMAEWKLVFETERNQIDRDLCCYVNKTGPTEDVLGVPVVYTINPRTKQVDYISSTLDILSATAFHRYGTRVSVWNEDFSDWLPLYISEEHFRRALPYFKKTIVKLCPNWNKQPPSSTASSTKVMSNRALKRKLWKAKSLKKSKEATTQTTEEKVVEMEKADEEKEKEEKGKEKEESIVASSSASAPASSSTMELEASEEKEKEKEKEGESLEVEEGGFHPEMVLDVLPKLMMTMVVLIADKGTHASIRALQGYAAFHRLLMAFLKLYPSLQEAVEERIRSFCASEEARHKDQCPSLGNWLPLLTVSEKYKWEDVADCYLRENFDRNALWICKDEPRLANIALPGAEPDTAEMEQLRISQGWVSTKVSKRLLMFQVYFLVNVARPKGMSLAQVARYYDRYLGAPSYAQQLALQSYIKRILEVDSWDEFWTTMHMEVPSAPQLAQMLRDGVCNSLRRGYHAADTDWSAIQKSGVSKILRQGESYVASPDLDEVLMKLGWNYQGSTLFLDASCFAYSDEGKELDVVDFQHRHALDKALVHSGDVMNAAKQSGEHTVTIHLHSLPANCTSLWLAISGWTTTLAGVEHPWVSLTDPRDGFELCRYSLEQTGNYISVVMCKLARTKADPKRWKVVAIGKMGNGRVSNYVPLRRDIASLIEQEKKAREARFI